MTTRSIPFGRPWITDAEKQAVLRILSGDILTHGPENKQFESDFSNFVGDGAHCIAVSSGMAALHLSYLQMGIGPGDEVIAPASTHTATAHAIEMVGARPVFVDCDPRTGNIDPALLEKALTPKTKALTLVHFLGIPCDMEKIMDFANHHKLKVVEDCALAIGSRFKKKHVGLFGVSGCFSFYPVKQITTGEGGMFITAHKDVADRVQKLRAFGVDRSFAERTMPGMYDVITLGLNYRMSDINAAIGRVQVQRLPEIMKRRRENFERLKKAVSKASSIRVLDSQSADAMNSHYCMSVVFEGKLVGRRLEIVNKLKEMGVGTSVYYPQPVPRMSYYKNKYGYDPKRFPNAEAISDHSIALPVGPHLSNDDLDYVGESFVKVVTEILK